MGVSLIFAEVLKGKWKHICCAAILVLAVVVFILGGINQDKTPTIGKAAGVQQETVDKSSSPNKVPKGKASVSVPRLHNMADMMNRVLPPEQRENPTVKKIMEIMASDSFQEQLEQQDPKTLDEFVQFFASQGLPELSKIDFDKVMADGYRIIEADYKAKNPGKVPEDEDDVMARRLAAAIEQSGPLGGMAKFMKDPNSDGLTALFRLRRSHYA
jgi:hypothetical protein